ncbi:MAG: beta-propeller domain-containing protein, partial [Bacilli bacterium]|nr:beta-propeller domain-containing protein [Bacilli bacterium]
EVAIAEITDIKYLPDSNYNAYTVISRIILEEDITLEYDIFLASSGWGQIYVSHNGIYFAGSHYYYTLLEYRQEGVLISYQFDQTGKVVFGGKGSYEGWVIDQFAMDEYDGYMRIATTTGWGETVKNRLYVFERKRTDTEYTLEVVGKIDENLGKPGETIQSVRFNGDIATVVTFERVDPFYTIDLSNPTNPTITGALEVPGYSVYQHFWTDDLVIGIGFDADELGVTQGMKLSLYNIEDPANPIEVGNSLLLTKEDQGWSYSEALYNHKAIMIDKNHQMIGFSLWRYNWSNGYYNSMNDYIVFGVDEEANQPIDIKYVVSHIDYFNEYNEYRTYWSRYDFSIDRGLRIDDYLFIVSGVAITSHNLVGDFGLVDEVVFVEATAEN